MDQISVKHFILMKLFKIKTDKSVVKAIFEYAQTTEVLLYTVKNAVQTKFL